MPTMGLWLAAPPWLQRDWDIEVAITITATTLAAPPWLQRDWDIHLICRFWRSSLQHLPDFKGIETSWVALSNTRTCLAAPPWLQRDWDRDCSQMWRLSPCSTSLTSKGLRPKSCLLNQRIQLAAPPWLQRDWDWHYPRHPLPVFLQHLPDFKGIETRHRTPYASATPLQHLPDFKGIETP